MSGKSASDDRVFTMASINLNNLSKIYPNGVNAVSRLNLKVDDGEFIVLVGPSGCGKTTTLRMISGLETITSGDIFIGEKRVNDELPKNRNISMVFQNYTLFPYMNVFDNIAFPLHLMKVDKAIVSRRVNEVGKLLNISHLLTRKPKELSGGEKQRTALGRAIIREPKAFLFDEPFSNLDANLRIAMRAEILKIHRKLNTTSIYVTHDQTEAMSLGDRIVVMDKGVVRQTGKPADVYSKPESLFVADFTGKINSLPGTVTMQNGKVNFVLDNDGFSATLFSIDKNLSGSLYNRFLPYFNKQVILAVRPEDVSLNSSAESPQLTAIKAKCLSLEHHGYESIGVFSAGNSSENVNTTENNNLISIRITQKEKPQIGDYHTLCLNLKKAHLFNP